MKTAAIQANLKENTVRRFFNRMHERIAEGVTTKTKIGGVGTVVEVGWKSYINLGLHGYIHTDVNQSQDFINPSFYRSTC